MNYLDLKLGHSVPVLQVDVYTRTGVDFRKNTNGKPYLSINGNPVYFTRFTNLEGVDKNNIVYEMYEIACGYSPDGKYFYVREIRGIRYELSSKYMRSLQSKLDILKYQTSNLVKEIEVLTNENARLIAKLKDINSIINP
jgi:hypothetical protein